MKKTVLSIAMLSVMSAGAFASDSMFDVKTGDQAKFDQASKAAETAKADFYKKDFTYIDGELVNHVDWKTMNDNIDDANNQAFDIISKQDANKDMMAELSHKDIKSMSDFKTKAFEHFDRQMSDAKNNMIHNANDINDARARQDAAAEMSAAQMMNKTTSYKYKDQEGDVHVIAYDAKTGKTTETIGEKEQATTKDFDAVDAQQKAREDIKSAKANIDQLKKKYDKASTNKDQAKKLIELSKIKARTDNQDMFSKHDEMQKEHNKVEKDAKDTATAAAANKRAITNNKTFKDIDKANKEGKDWNADGKSTTDGIRANNQAIHQVGKYAQENRGMIEQNSKGIAKNKADIQDLRQDFKNMASDYNSFKKQTNGAIAGLAAMSNIPNPTGVGSISIGAGVGYYQNENAVSVGMGYQMTESLTFKTSIASSTGQMKPIVGAGMSYTFN